MTTPHYTGQHYDVVVVALSDWDGPKRIRQFLSEALAQRGHRVLFVEAYYTLSKFVRKPSAAKLFAHLKGPRQIEPNVWAVAMPPFLPGGEFSRRLSKFNWTIASWFIRQAMKRIGFHQPVLMQFAYNSAPLIGTLRERIAFYYCNDAFDKLAPTEGLCRRIRTLERELIRSAQFTVTVSDKLTSERAADARTIYTVKHGVDYDLFRRDYGNRTVRPELLALRRPVIGYSGVIRYVLDLDLVHAAAVARPDWSFVFVGPVTESGHDFYTRVEKLKKLPNVLFTGNKPADELPALINGFDVCMLPYLRDDLSTYFAAPLKFYEYLALGKPVVSTVGPYDLEKEVVQNTTSTAEFTAAVARMLAEDNDIKRERRRAIARDNSWDHRATRLEEILETEIRKLPVRKLDPRR